MYLLFLGGLDCWGFFCRLLGIFYVDSFISSLFDLYAVYFIFLPYYTG